MTVNTKLTNKTVLKSNRLFADLPDDVLDRLSSLAIRRTAANGAMLFSQDDTGDLFYGIVSGRIRISAMSADGHEIHFVELTAGDTFGEIALLDGGPRTASAFVTEDAILFVIERSAFLAMLKNQPLLAQGLLERLCERVRWTTEIVEDMSLLSVRAQIAKRIQLLAQSFGTDSEHGRELRIAQRDLAAFLGLSRQAVNTHLQEWHHEGWLDLSRGMLLIKDAERLKRLVDDSGQ
jgi:CRP/FNR family cyclic AMP-dependent transcriptional regulator